MLGNADGHQFLLTLFNCLGVQLLDCVVDVLTLGDLPGLLLVSQTDHVAILLTADQEHLLDTAPFRQCEPDPSGVWNSLSDLSAHLTICPAGSSLALVAFFCFFPAK